MSFLLILLILLNLLSTFLVLCKEKLMKFQKGHNDFQHCAPVYGIFSEVRLGTEIRFI